MRLSAALVSVFVIAGTAGAFAQTDYPWLKEISSQAAGELDCEVEYFLNAREGDLGGKPAQEARIQCRDGRRFDAVRESTEGPFRFLACETQVC
ncbi:MAG: hypothetical protein R3D65_09780 [Zhengella sp.]|uniref:hypothetical protein n=1 Tax=Zhengella sp. TaxID=2282762 RepID=UPI001D6B8797|nr:hypothetical protein [Notoacmeibacter sp.]MCC0028282.1 hypothetical protein [Brucellaceae bacterium]